MHRQFCTTHDVLTETSHLLNVSTRTLIKGVWQTIQTSKKLHTRCLALTFKLLRFEGSIGLRAVAIKQEMANPKHDLGEFDPLHPTSTCFLVTLNFDNEMANHGICIIVRSCVKFQIGQTKKYSNASACFARHIPGVLSIQSAGNLLSASACFTMILSGSRAPAAKRPVPKNDFPCSSTTRALYDSHLLTNY